MDRIRSARAVLASVGLFAGSPSIARPQGSPATPRRENLRVGESALRPSIGSRNNNTRPGPVVTLDEAHHNFHTIDGRYRPFANLLEADGFTVSPGRSTFSPTSLKGIKILVVANSLEERNLGAPNWRLPSYSAFDSSEIAATAAWV